MRRRLRAGRDPVKARRRKTATLKRGNGPKTARRRGGSAAGQHAKLTQLRRELNEALRQQAAMTEVLQVISSSPGDLQRVFDTMLKNARRLCEAEFGNIYRWDGEALRLVASHNAPPAFVEFRRRSPFRLGPVSLVSRMIATKTVTHVVDAAALPEFLDRSYPPLVAAVELGGVRTYLAVPMLNENELVGAFTMYRQEVRPFTEKQIALLTSFASQAVIAIENTRLLNELRQRTDELGRSIEELRGLGEVSQAVNSTLDLETVLSTIVAKAVQLSGTEAGAIYVYEGGQRQIRLRATYGLDQGLIDALARHLDLDEPDAALALARDEPIQVADLREEPGSAANEIILRAGYRARLTAPLTRGSDVVGVLAVHRREPGRFAQKSVDLIKNFAAQSVLAIQNARLFKSVEERTRELARSLEMLRRERDNKLMNLEAMAASIGHEVRQPLAAIASNGGAALRFLARVPPNIDEARAALNRMVKDSHRASQVFDNIRALFKAERGREPIDVSELALGVLQALREELIDHGVTTHTRLTAKLPPVAGHKGQLQEVLINLVRNAIEAMDAVKDDRRVLQVSAEHDGDNAIIVAVEDSGPGIDPRQLDSIFDAFVTTKPNGMGLGLAICRMIVDRHEGQLSVAPAHPRGSVFRVVLPAERTGAG